MKNTESLLIRLKNMLLIPGQNNKKILILAGVVLFAGGIAVGSLIDISTPTPQKAIKTSKTTAIPLKENYLNTANYSPAGNSGKSNNVDNSSKSDNIVATSPTAEATAMSLKRIRDLKKIRIKAGQGMMDVLIKTGADRKDAHQAIKALSGYFDMRKLQVGQTLQAAYSPQGRLTGLNMRKDFDHMIRVRRINNSFTASLQDLPSIKLTRLVTGVIKDSLYLSAARAGLPDSVIADLIRIFSFDVDFQREIRKGDRFEILYQRRMSKDGRRVEEGHILYAKLTLSGTPISLYRYKPAHALFAGYFHADGKSARRMLMKTPIEGARLSSYYGMRKHPVLGYTRMHKGVDFSAPTGTPIMAAGDGIVERASRYGSFGNYIRIRHNGTYETAYAHMSRYGRGIKRGKRVKQGQIIGYVGATGRVTGRHLHYEVLMNGKQVNPLRLKIPTGIRLAGRDKRKFLTLAGDIDRQILARKHNILLTSNERVALNAAPLMLTTP